MSATTPKTATGPAIYAGGLREGLAQVGEVELHYV